MGTSTPESVPRPVGRGGGRALRVLAGLERLALYLVAVLFLVAALGVLATTLVDVVRAQGPWWVRLADLFEGLLLGVIILEIYSSVLIAITRGRFSVEPFLIIGIVAALRHILSIGVQVALGPGSEVESQHQLLDVGTNVAIIFVLVAALALVRWSSRWSEDEAVTPGAATE
ncbi:phosphate-starvation-inducible PsiE family protein [Gandjariella thermophila]|uniref:Uncharacterized protein n=1 Tax=Gandjariella thermophila TaxID=1931992 RepID=A0A4D4IX04_9PSEU|nr:phosphate-starvation-inducible PsiE family protein [Gandjariella thermophila]GDY28731.1 hypothetical protein GTS_03640 [Gandjariella thermophila]